MGWKNILLSQYIIIEVNEKQTCACFCVWGCEIPNTLKNKGSIFVSMIPEEPLTSMGSTCPMHKGFLVEKVSSDY